jgi:hypothetical protein
MSTTVGGTTGPYNGTVAPVSGNESSHSAASWPAVFAGAFVLVAVTLILLWLGSGLGLASISPWSNAGASATTFAISTAIGLIVIQWIASAAGGYVTGRLRTKWVGVHTHEVFFRDTANGFVTWALATVAGTMLLASAASSLVGGAAHTAATVAGGAAQGIGQAASHSGFNISDYSLDSLFRSDHPDANNDQNARAQASRILVNGITNGEMPAADRTYLAQMVAARTGLSQADAEKRVDAVIAQEKAAATKAKQAADDARKAAAKFAIFTALSMVIGAFIACASAAYGGSVRDEH